MLRFNNTVVQTQIREYRLDIKSKINNHTVFRNSYKSTELNIQPMFVCRRSAGEP